MNAPGDAPKISVRDLHKAFGEGDHEKVITSEIKDREAIVDSIKTFLGKGR